MAAHAWTKANKRNQTLIQTAEYSYLYRCQVNGCTVPDMRFAESSQWVWEDVYCNGSDMGVLIGCSFGVAEPRHLEMLSQYFCDLYEIPVANMPQADLTELTNAGYVTLSDNLSEIWITQNGAELVEE